MAVIDYIEAILSANDNGYTIKKGVLSATEFGVPQKRMRFVIIGVKKVVADQVDFPVGDYDKPRYRTVRDAIEDIACIDVTTDVNEGNTGEKLKNNLFRFRKNTKHYLSSP